MAGGDFIKRPIGEFIQQVQTTVTVATLAPANYGSTLPEVADMGSGLASLVSLNNTANVAREASIAANAARDAQRDVVEGKLRRFNAKAQATPACTPAMLEAADLPVHDTSPSPVPAPSFVPFVVVEEITRLSHKLRVGDLSKPKGGKPEGCSGFLVYYKVGPTAPAGIRDCVGAGYFTKTRFEIEFAEADGNKQVWYIVIPVNATGGRGPMSETVGAMIAA